MSLLRAGEAVEIGGVRYNGLELLEPYRSAWSRWLPLSDPPAPWTHVWRRNARWFLLGWIVVVLVLGSLLWDSSRLRWPWRLVVLVAYGFAWAIAGHVLWAGQPLEW